MTKAIIKTAVYFLLALILAYFIFALSLGGFGRKSSTTSPLPDDDQVFLFAHRGVVDSFPENSREAIERALTLGFRGLEIDVRRTADGEFILFHDGDGRRLLGIDEKISALTRDQLQTYPLLFQGKTSGSNIITLKEMLDVYSDDFIIYLDMKLGNFRDVDDLIQILYEYNVLDSVIFASASFLVVLYVELRYPQVLTAMEGFNAGNEWILKFIPKKIKPDFLSGTAKKVTREHMEWLRKKNLDRQRIVYGADSTNYQLLLELGVKSMIIDYFPGL